MPRTRIYCPRPSKSARALSRATGVRRINYRRPSRYTPRSSDTIINWGCSTYPVDYRGPRWLNHPDRVGATLDKRRFFAGAWTCPDVRVPRWTTDGDFAKDQFRKTVSRLLLQSSGGRGIVITEQGQQPPEAPLYVEYIPRRAEFRIHVIDGKVVDTQRKIRDPNREPASWQVRSHSNGFIFARESGQPSPESLDMAVSTVEHFGLDFGAVDVLENRRGSWVLEVNTAPGLEGQTLETYSKNLLTLL